MTTQPPHTPVPWKAQQDLRSWRNEGIFDGTNPDRYGNQNAWGIYGDHTLIMQLQEAESWRSQEEVNANANFLVLAVNHHDELVRLLDGARTVLELFWNKESVPPALLRNSIDEIEMYLEKVKRDIEMVK